MSNPVKPCILFVSLRKDTSDYYLEELTEIFQNEVTILTHNFEEEGKADYDAQAQTAVVILAAGPASYARCLTIFPPEKIILFRRDILFPYYLDQIFLLPPGTRVLVVNEVQESAQEIIRQLQEKNITHLEYIPYWDGCDTDASGAAAAISPGMFRYCPPEVTNRIDIRRRHLSVDIFIQLLQRLNLGLEYVERLLAFHSNLLFDTYKRLSETHAWSLSLRKTLESILSNVSDAIVLTEDGRIIECNAAAEKLFRRKRAQMLEMNLQAIPGMRTPWPEPLDQPKLVTLHKADYLCVRTDISASHASDQERVLYTFKAVSELERMEAHVRSAQSPPRSNPAKHRFSDIIAADASMRRIVELAGEMARSPLGASILITGESGTGKELFAQAIHNNSKRAGQPFVAVNFGAIPDNLVESELFGYESGAFTGANKAGKKGLFEIAQHGTIFLDEIGNASLWLQARLLRMLEEKELIRLGGTTVIPVDVRIIAATNTDLAEMCRQGTFRADLYHRLNTFPLKIPPLRERPACIETMIAHFQAAQGLKRAFSEEAKRCIREYTWPGNARELKNMLDFLTLKPGNGPIGIDDLPHDVRNNASSPPDFPFPPAPSPLLAALLRLLDHNAGTSPRLGRGRLRGELAAQGFTVSESALRTLTGRLADAGLIAVGRTKQGALLTPRGRKLLASLQGLPL